MGAALLIMILAATGVAGYALGMRHACAELTIRRGRSVVPERRKSLK